MIAGADLGGKGGRPPPPPPSGNRPPVDPKGPPLVLFKKSIFGRPTLKFFLRRLWRQYILILRGDRTPKKRNFSVKIFQKVPKNAFFGLFFQNFACGARSFEIFLKIRPPPRENPRSAPWMIEYLSKPKRYII